MNVRSDWREEGTNDLTHSTEILKKLIDESSAEVIDKPEKNK